MNVYKVLTLGVFLTLIIGMVGLINVGAGWDEYESRLEYNLVEDSLYSDMGDYETLEGITAQEDSSQIDSGIGGFSSTKGLSTSHNLFKTGWIGLKTGYQQVKIHQDGSTSELDKMFYRWIGVFYIIVASFLLYKLVMVLLNKDVN